MGLLVSVWGGDAQTLFVRFASPPPIITRCRVVFLAMFWIKQRNEFVEQRINVFYKKKGKGVISEKQEQPSAH